MFATIQALPMAAGKFTLADRLGAKSVPCRVSGCSRSWIQLSNKAFGLAGSRRPLLAIPPKHVRSLPGEVPHPQGCLAPLRPQGMHGQVDLAGDGSAGSVCHAAACAQALVRRLPATARQPAGPGNPLRRARLHTHRHPDPRTTAGFAGRTGGRVGAGATNWRDHRGIPVRAVRPGRAQAEGPGGQLRGHSHARASGRGKRTIRSRPSPPASPTSRPGACAPSAVPSSASWGTARSVAAPPAARPPGPGRAAISSMPAWPTSRCPRRRRACASAASICGAA
jgi:hypothetical protein